MRAEDVLSVSALTARIKTLIEGSPELAHVYVRGEISNYKLHTSGHIYMTLKDENSVLNAVMFRSDAAKLKFALASGMKIIARGRIGVFPRSGQYQLYMDAAIPDGVGELYVAFEQLKKRLSDEGLFDASSKKPLPKYPETIAMVTSPTGAAVRDMLRITGRRFPLSDILLCPVLVQGENAPAQIASMIAYVNKYALADVIITGRGGGSIEDLWAFNDERVARAIAASDIPVISAVGHEPDVTISDFVADVRAATPSNAAEIVVPDKNELYAYLRTSLERMRISESKRISFLRERLRTAAGKRVMSSPTAYVDERRMLLLYMSQRLASCAERITAEKRRKFVRLISLLDAMSPLKVLARGYSIVTDSDGKTVTSALSLSEGDIVDVRLSEGSAQCTVMKTGNEVPYGCKEQF